MKQSTRLDGVDLNILKQLQRSGRITNQDLAAHINMSPSSCLHRVRRLEEQGYIATYHAHLNLAAICRTITCLSTVTLNNPSQEDYNLFETRCCSTPEVVECYTVSGSFDFVLKVVTTDMAAYLDLTELFMENIGCGVNISTHVVMKEVKPFRGYPLERLL